MSGIMVSGKTAALLEQAHSVLEGKGLRRSRRIPQFLPNGDEVKTVEQVAAMMRVDSVTAAQYVDEQKSFVSFRLGVEAKSVLLQYGGFEMKDIVRSAAGVRKYGQPLGSIIIKDVTLPNLKVIDEPYDGWLTVQGDSGTTYEVGLDDEDTGKWVACRLPGGWDDVVVEGGKDQNDVLKKLSKHDLASVAKPAAPKRKPSPVTRAVPGQGNHVKPPKAPIKIDKTGERLVDKGFDSDDSWDDYWDAQSPEDLQSALDYLESSKYDMDALRAARRASKRKAKPAAGAPKGTFARGTSSATSSNDPTATTFNPDTLKRSGLPIAASVKPGDIVAPRWAADNPARVVKVGKITNTGRVTIYYRDEKGNESRQTYKINERLISFSEGGGAAPKAPGGGTRRSGTGSARGGRATPTSRTSPSSSASPSSAGSSKFNKDDFYSDPKGDPKPKEMATPDSLRKGDVVLARGGRVGEVTGFGATAINSRHVKLRDVDTGEEFTIRRTDTIADRVPVIRGASREDRMAARNAQNAKDWPVGTQVSVTVHSLGGREEVVTGTVTGHSSGGVTVQTNSGHGDLSVEPSKLSKAGEPVGRTFFQKKAYEKLNRYMKERYDTYFAANPDATHDEVMSHAYNPDQKPIMVVAGQEIEDMKATHDFFASQERGKWPIDPSEAKKRVRDGISTYAHPKQQGVTLKRTRQSGALEVEMDGEKYTFIPGSSWGSGWRRGWSEDGPTISLSDAAIRERLEAWKKKS